MSRRPLAALCLLAASAIAACTGGTTGSGAPAGGAAGSAGAAGAGDETRVAVSVNESGCSPTTASATAGRVVFEVTNAGPELGEFEVLSGTTVVDEVENIVPGFVVNLTSHLEGGSYELICYATRSPRAALTVTGTAEARPTSAVVDAATLDGYRDQYEAYVREQATELTTQLAPFVAAVEKGDLAAAKAAYAPSRPAWERIEPVAELFSDLDTRMDAREEDFAGGVTDPEFLGWHRLEKGLWADGTTDGLATIAKGLEADAKDLTSRLATMDIESRVIARGAGELIEEVAQSKLTGEEDRYSQADLWSVSANVAGSKKIVDILRPTLQNLDATYLQDVDGAFSAVDAVIAKYADGTGYQPFSTVTQDDLKALQARMAKLSEVLGELPGRLGLAA